MSSSSSSHDLPQFFACPFCGLRDADIYALHLHIETAHTPDSPFITKEEKGSRHSSHNKETGYVLCPEPSCGEPVLRLDLRLHMDMHLAERVALTEFSDGTGTPETTIVNSAGSFSANNSKPQKSSSKSKRKSHKVSSSSKPHRSRHQHHHLHTPSQDHGPAETTVTVPVISRSSKKVRRLGTSELGPYAMEQQMPPELYKELAAGPPITYHMEFGPNQTLVRVATVANETPNLIPVLAKLCDKDPNVTHAWLCHEGVRHIGKQLPREGGFCGYRNIQMMISYIQSAQVDPSTNPFPGMVPSIIKLQEWIEAGWEMGINNHGKIETGGIKGTRKYIGTSEVYRPLPRLSCFSYPALTRCAPRPRRYSCGAKHLTNSEDLEAHDALFEFVERYYEQGRQLGCLDRVVQTRRPPIYFQHSGHSMTVVGLEVYQDGSRSLLVFDPSFSPSPGIRDLVGTKRISSKIDGTPLMKLHRRGAQYLKKYREFELLTVQANAKDTDVLQGFHMNPYLKRSFAWSFGRRS